MEFSLNKHKSLSLSRIPISLPPSSHLPHLSDTTIHDSDPGGGISISHHGSYISPRTEYMYGSIVLDNLNHIFPTISNVKVMLVNPHQSDWVLYWLRDLSRNSIVFPSFTDRQNKNELTAEH